MQLVDGVRACDGIGDAGADVFRADMALEFGMFHELSGLLACAAEEKVAARGMEAVSEFADGSETCGVDGGHVAEAKNDDGRKAVDIVRNLVELIGCPEEKWAVHAINDSVVGNVFALKDV